MSINTACRVLRVTDNGYRAWRGRPINQRTIRHEMLAETIADIRRASQGCYGVQRVDSELVKGLGIHLGRARVGLGMSSTRLGGISGSWKRYFNREQLITAANLVSRQFTAVHPNRLSAPDITYHTTKEGTVCACVV